MSIRLLLLAALAAAPAVVRADWLQFRGPDGSGLSPDGNAPASLRADSGVGWKAELPGRGLSSPIVVGNRVFVTCSSGPRQERLHVLCFDASSGVKAWERRFWATGRTMCHEKTSIAAPTPASDGRHVYVIFASNDAACLDLEGNLRWFRGLGRDYPNASNSLGMSSSPVIVDEVLVAQVESEGDAFTIGLDAATGLNRWKIERPKMANWTSPSVFRDATGRALVLLQSGKGLTAVRPADGRVVWNHEVKASTVPSSVVAGGVIYLPAGGLTALDVTGSEAAPKELWKAPQLRPGTPSPVVAGERIFSLNDAGVLTCGERGSGNRLWQLRLKGPFSGSPVMAGDRLYCVSEKGVVQVVDITKPEGEVASELELAETILCTPAIADGAVFVRSDKTLWRLGNPGG